MSHPQGFIEKLVTAALHQRLFVLLCLAALLVTGVVAYQQLPVEAFPDLTNNQVVIVTEAPALAAPEVEQRVTYPIEIAMMGAPGAEQVRSISKFGLSIVTVIFDDAVPTYFARQLVAERLTDARGRLPEGLEPTMGPVATAFGEVYQYLVESETHRPHGGEDHPRLGHPHAPALGARRERGQLVGRPHEAVPRGGRPRAARRSTGCRCVRCTSRSPPATPRSAAATSSTGPSGTPCAGWAWPATRPTCERSC